MASEWQRIEQLFHATLQLTGEQRAEYLKRECPEEQLRLEVESLIAEAERENDFIQDSAVRLGLEVISSQSRRMEPGQVIGHYKIVRQLGIGGMGEVYLADDCTLERQVALKFVTGRVTHDQWAREQLMKEARAVARLENPNTCGVHSLEEIGENTFIVMPYVEGQTLAELLSRERLSLDRTLDFAEQIVNALTAAHLHGIIHRDIKPRNIVVTPEGQIKVLDFGLAKFVQQSRTIMPAAGGSDHTAQHGFIAGTLPYMSPEQTQGENLDWRSDIFSFGIVLHEMLSGHNPFLRESNEETLNAINEAQVPPLPLKVPEALEAVVGRCLAKNPGDRFETTESLLSAIRSIRRKRRQSVKAYVYAIRTHPHFARYAVAVLVLLLCVLGTGAYIFSKVSKEHTLALLPIKNLNADSSLDYLSVGLTRNLADKLSYLPRVKVRSLTDAPSNSTEDVVRVGRELHVDAALTGEVFKENETIILRLRIVNTDDGAVSLEQRFNVDPANMFALQDDITRRVADGLGLWLIGDEKKLLTKRQTNNEEALRLNMRGRVAWRNRDRENVEKAIKDFEQAVDLDPAYAKAYAGLADCYVLQAGNVLYGPAGITEAIRKAKFNANKALEIDPSLAEARTSIGMIKLKYDWEWQQAEQDFKLAIAQNDAYPPAHYWYANLLAATGRFDEALTQSQLARDLDPYSPLGEMNYARTLYWARRYQEADDYFAKLLYARPDYPQYLHVRAYVQIQLGQTGQAIASLEKLHQQNPTYAAAGLGFAYGKAGRKSEALKILDELSFAKQAISPHEKAIVYIGIGENDKAIQMLEEAYQERFQGLVFLATDPLYDSLRSDARFKSLCERIGRQDKGPESQTASALKPIR